MYGKGSDDEISIGSMYTNKSMKIDPEYHHNAVAIRKRVISLNVHCSCDALRTVSEAYKGNKIDDDLLRWK